MPAQMVRSVSRTARHTTTIDIAVLGLIVQQVSSEIEGIFEAQLDRADLLREGEPDSDTDKPKSRSAAATKFDEHAEIVLQIDLVPFMNVLIAPIIAALRNRLIERIQTLTELQVHAVHIHVAGLRAA
ncbi:MAG: Asp23/Gls24 family envelope stress response protein [Herpetosiphonaceae bacterium]|nr:Asp23/Gls24 family envelope stress response protein [Herpetosiphonaceae bacterium]